VGQGGKRGDPVSPGDGVFPGKVRFAEVIENDGVLIMTLAEASGGLKVGVLDQQVIRQASGLQQANTPRKRRVLDEQRRRGFVLNQMAEADQFRGFSPLFQLPLKVRGAQVDPADHADDPTMLFRQGEQGVGLVEAVPRLHGDTARDAVLVEQRLQIVWQKVTSQGVVSIVDPRVILRTVAPEVLMGVHA
jgi:hypothetical protein